MHFGNVQRPATFIVGLETGEFHTSAEPRRAFVNDWRVGRAGVFRPKRERLADEQIAAQANDDRRLAVRLSLA